MTSSTDNSTMLFRKKKWKILIIGVVIIIIYFSIFIFTHFVEIFMTQKKFDQQKINSMTQSVDHNDASDNVNNMGALNDFLQFRQHQNKPVRKRRPKLFRYITGFAGKDFYTRLNLIRQKTIQNSTVTGNQEDTGHLFQGSSQKMSSEVKREVVEHNPGQNGDNKADIDQDDDVYVEVSKTKTYGSVTFPEFVEYGNPGDPGEYGQAFFFRKGDLTEADAKKKEEDFDIHYFDEWTSKKISVHRILPDDKKTKCKDQMYNLTTTVSVLIVFYNEAWTTLLRTIHSVLDRSPSHLLKEIVLLDDFSDMDHLKEPLEVYLQKLPNVRLLRAQKRIGLMRARNLVFDHSTGDVVVFLDSHVECFPGWLEPLIAPIQANEKAVTFPVIELINVHTFRVGRSTVQTNVGGLILNSLTFNWLYSRPKDFYSIDNSPSPTMPGGLYAISRSYFAELGKYDPGMELWGHENLEISFKIWMCGGSILLVHCSHVGHIYRKYNPAFRGRGRLGFKNAFRVAEVWMDHYKHFFYEKILYNIQPFGDVSSRLQLRKSLQCHDFAWYLQNVYPELRDIIDENSTYMGHIKNQFADVCIDKRLSTSIDVKRCIDNNNQMWNLGTNGVISSGDKTIGYEVDKSVTNVTSHKLVLFTPGPFIGNKPSVWTYDDKQRLVENDTGLCLQVVPFMRQAQLKNCTSTYFQKWRITTRKEMQAEYKNRGVPIDWSI